MAYGIRQVRRINCGCTNSLQSGSHFPFQESSVMFSPKIRLHMVVYVSFIEITGVFCWLISFKASRLCFTHLNHSVIHTKGQKKKEYFERPGRRVSTRIRYFHNISDCTEWLFTGHERRFITTFFRFPRLFKQILKFANQLRISSLTEYNRSLKICLPFETRTIY